MNVYVVVYVQDHEWRDMQEEFFEQVYKTREKAEAYIARQQDSEDYKIIERYAR